MKNGLKWPKNRAENFPVRKKIFPSWKNNIFQLENFFSSNWRKFCSIEKSIQFGKKKSHNAR